MTSCSITRDTQRDVGSVCVYAHMCVNTRIPRLIRNTPFLCVQCVHSHFMCTKKRFIVGRNFKRRLKKKSSQKYSCAKLSLRFGHTGEQNSIDYSFKEEVDRYDRMTQVLWKPRLHVHRILKLRNDLAL